ncbi:MAG: DUF1365 domain-containing protein [Gammaproteobacteria bacterium]
MNAAVDPTLPSAPAAAHHVLEGRVWHVRKTPFRHAFNYPIALLELDLDHLEDAFHDHPLWRLDRPGLASFRQNDHLGGGADLAGRARTAVAEQLGFRPTGPIRLICQPRYLGYSFNPVTFYLCHAPDGPLEAILLEVSNTPWNERHRYALDCRGQTAPLRFELDKAFHVSPFMPMAMRYRFTFTPTDTGFSVIKENLEHGVSAFVARMALTRSSLHRRALARLLRVWPPHTFRTIAAIYGQALRLWLRGARYHRHPST